MIDIDLCIGDVSFGPTLLYVYVVAFLPDGSVSSGPPVIITMVNVFEGIYKYVIGQSFVWYN